MAKVKAFSKGKTFVPGVNYRWEPEDVFEITGQQLANLYHCSNSEINNPGGATIAQKYEAYNTVMDILKLGVEQGVIVESDLSNLNAEKLPEIDSRVNNLFNHQNNINE